MFCPFIHIFAILLPSSIHPCLLLSADGYTHEKYRMCTQFDTTVSGSIIAFFLLICILEFLNNEEVSFVTINLVV